MGRVAIPAIATIQAPELVYAQTVSVATAAVQRARVTRPTLVVGALPAIVAKGEPLAEGMGLAVATMIPVTPLAVSLELVQTGFALAAPATQLTAMRRGIVVEQQRGNTCGFSNSCGFPGEPGFRPICCSANETCTVTSAVCGLCEF